MCNKSAPATLLVAALWASGSALWADEEPFGDVSKLLPSAKVTLQQGLAAAEAQGTPISAKFEIDEGHFQLSVYAAKAQKFYEVIVDRMTGAVVKSEAITGGDDLAAAKAQSAALTKAKRSLKSAVDAAEQAAPGYRAAGVEPKLAQGRTVATVTLLKGAAVKTVQQSLE